jgi:tetratricopeptide (TPR) repeat protein
VLSEHFDQSENYEKGAKYSRLTAKKSEKTASLGDAIVFAAKCIECLERLPRTDAVIEDLIDARTTLGLYMSQMGYFVEAKEAVEPIVEFASKRNYKRRLCQIYIIMGAYKYMGEENFPEAFANLEKALEISSEINDVVTHFFANFWLGFSLSLDCQFAKASYYLQKALDINLAGNNLWGMSVTKSFVSTLVHCFQGKINLADETTKEALEMAEDSGDLLTKAVAYVARGWSYFSKGYLDRAKEHLLQGANLCERSNHLGWIFLAQEGLGHARFQSGEYKESIAHYEKAAWLYEQNRLSASAVKLNLLGAARARVLNNEKGIDLESLYSFLEETKTKNCEGESRRYMGEILLNIDDQHFSEAKDWIEKAIEADKKNGIMLHLGWDYALYADLFKRKGNITKAKANLTKAIDIYRECGADGWVEKAEKELTSIS